MNELAPSPSQRDFPSYGLKSLWDMFEHRASSLLGSTIYLRSMLDNMDLNPTDPVNAKDVKHCLNAISRECGNAGLIVSKTMVDDLSDVAGEQYSNKFYADKIRPILDVIHKELRTNRYFRVRSELVKYVLDRPLFDKEVYDAFPSAIRDIEDGGKALAFELGTASAFHMMRVMEHGLKSLAALLQIPFAPSWEAHISEIEKRINAKYKTKGVRWKRDEPYFRELLGDLQSVKIAWRNPTMHIERHYSPEEAEDVLRAVRTFMSRLSQKIQAKK